VFYRSHNQPQPGKLLHKCSITLTNLASVGSLEIPIVDHTPDALVAEPTEHLGCTCDTKEVKEACLLAQLQQQVPVNNMSRGLSCSSTLTLNYFK